MGEIVFEKLLEGGVHKACDVGLRTDAGWVAYEVQLSASVRPDLLRDLIQKDIEAGFIKVYICVETEKDLKAVEKVVAELEPLPNLFGEKLDVKDKVEPKLLADFL